MKAKPETRFYDEYELSRPAKAAVEATRARLLQGLGEAVQASDQPIVQAVRIHILTPVLRSQQDRKLGRMRMAEPSRKSPMQAMPVSGRSSQAQTQTQAQTQAQAQAQSQSQSQGAKPRDRAGSRNAQSTPQLARLTISQRKMERNAHLTGVQLAAKQEEGAKSMKVASLEVYKADRERKLSQTTKQTEREIKRQRMRDALKYIIDLAVRRRNALRTALPASPLLQVPETRKRPRKRMPESTFAAQAGSSAAVVSNDASLIATFDAPLSKGRASSYLDPSIPLPCPPPAALVEPAKEGEEDKRAAIKNGKKETEEDDKEMGYKFPTALQKPGYLKLNHANSEDRGEPLPQIVIPQAGAEVQPTKVSNHEEGKEHSLSPLKRLNLLSPNDPRKRPRRNTASVESNADFARSMEQLALSRLYK